MKLPRYCDDQTIVNRKLAQELAETYGTPLFVYDSRMIRSQTEKVYQAFSWNPGFRTFFPVRMLDNPHLLRVIHEAGCGVQCCNGTELRLAQMAGIPGEDILYYQCFPDYDEWNLAMSSGAVILADRAQQLEDIRLHRYGNRIVGLRLSTDGYVKPHGLIRKKFTTKLGMRKGELFDAAKLAKERGFSGIGLYLSLGVDYLGQGLLAATAKAVLDVAGELQETLGIPVSWCNIGGDIQWSTDWEYVDYLAPEAEAIEKNYRQALLKWPALENMVLFTELGRHIAMPAGVAITRVTGTKALDFTYVGTELSTAHLPDATRHGRIYDVSKPGRSSVAACVRHHIVGALPDANDELTNTGLLKPVRMGELLLFHNTGVLGRATSSNFGGTLRCAEVLLGEEGHRLIRRRETFQDYVSCLEGYQQEKQCPQQECAGAEAQGDIRDLGSKA